MYALNFYSPIVEGQLRTQADRVLVVRHSYKPGLRLPGGGGIIGTSAALFLVWVGGRLGPAIHRARRDDGAIARAASVATASA